MSVTRRGEPEASTSLGRPIISSPAQLLESIGDATLGQIIGRHLDQYLVAGQHPDAILAHAASGVSDDLMFVFELDAEGGVRQQLRDDTGEFQEFFFSHSRSSIDGDVAFQRRIWRGTWRKA